MIFGTLLGKSKSSRALPKVSVRKDYGTSNLVSCVSLDYIGYSFNSGIVLYNFLIKKCIFDIETIWVLVSFDVSSKLQ